MNEAFLKSLIGPFSMGEVPAHVGFYYVAIKDSDTFEMWHWDGTQWLDSDDGLGISQAPARASGWYGQLAPGCFETPDTPESNGDDGLDV